MAIRRTLLLFLATALILGCKKKEEVSIEDCGDIDISYKVISTSFPKDKEFYLDKIEQIKGHKICVHLYREKKTKEVMPVFYTDGYYVLGILIDKKGRTVQFR